VEGGRWKGPRKRKWEVKSDFKTRQRGKDSKIETNAIRKSSESSRKWACNKRAEEKERVRERERVD
jgi:hypothetical protein